MFLKGFQTERWKEVNFEIYDLTGRFFRFLVPIMIKSIIENFKMIKLQNYYSVLE